MSVLDTISSIISLGISTLFPPFAEYPFLIYFLLTFINIRKKTQKYFFIFKLFLFFYYFFHIFIYFLYIGVKLTDIINTQIETTRNKAGGFIIIE
jgi:drug/metabolite transporter (DMT)-like permease